MAHKLIITAYQPDFSPELKSWIKQNISPSMVNPQDDEKSYFLDTILAEAPVLSLEDSVIITQLQYENVEYVEF